MPNKKINQDKLQLAVVRTSHILTNYNLPLKTALGLLGRVWNIIQTI